jgi:hypothetical protein
VVGVDAMDAFNSANLIQDGLFTACAGHSLDQEYILLLITMKFERLTVMTHKE